MQHLGRADAVENVAAGEARPFGADFFRQGLAGGEAAAQPVLDLGRTRFKLGVERGIERRHAAEHAGAEPGEHIEHRVGRRAAGVKHRRRADRHGEGHAIAQAIGEEQLCGGEHEVIGGNPQHLRAKSVGGVFEAAMAWRTPLGWPVEPEE